MLLLEGDQRRQLLQDENLFLEHAYWAYPQSLESHAILIWWTETSDVFISWKRIFKPLTVAEQTLAEQSILLNKQGIAINYGMAAFDVRRRQKERDTGLSGRYISCHYLPVLLWGLVTSQRALPRLCYFWRPCENCSCQLPVLQAAEMAGNLWGNNQAQRQQLWGARDKEKEKKGRGEERRKNGSWTEVLLMTLPFCSPKLWACSWEGVMCQGKLLCVRNIQIQSHHRFHFSLFQYFQENKKKGLLLTIAVFHSRGGWLSSCSCFSLLSILPRNCYCVWWLLACTVFDT